LSEKDRAAIIKGREKFRIELGIPKPPPTRITATAYVCEDPSKIPPRERIYGNIVRGFASGLVAPGGLGKTSKTIVDALAIVTGIPLLGIIPDERCNVWLWNGEDPKVEMQRRIAAVRIHHKVSSEDIAGRLFLDSGRDQPIRIATQAKSTTTIAEPLAACLIEQIKANNIGVLIIDPFVSSHSVSENDNNAIDMVVKQWARIAEETNCAILLVHHVRKANGGEVTADHSRGASALHDGLRGLDIINPMSATEAAKIGVNHRAFFRVNDGKNNMGPLSNQHRWFQIVSVSLGNAMQGRPADLVGVVECWQWPRLEEIDDSADLAKVQKIIAEGEWREHVLSKNWAGHAVAQALGLDPQDPAARERIKGRLRAWIKKRALKVALGRVDGREVGFVVVGDLAVDPAESLS